jgi:hypothetical protein
MKVTALLVGRHGTLRVETGLTENVSSRGARVVSTSKWPLDETILVALPGFHFRSSARVTYCDSLGVGRFGIGLEFVGAVRARPPRKYGPGAEGRRKSLSPKTGG